MSEFRVFRIRRDNRQVQGKIETCSLDELPDGEVLIRAAYSGVNYKDALAATGMGKIIRKFPCVGGIDVSGRVEQSSHPDFKPGMPVLVSGYGLGVEHDGGYADFVRVPAEWVVPLPDGLSLFDAMALGTAGLTVALALKRMLDNGQTPDMGPIAVTGATGGVGSIAIDLFSHLGYQVTAVTGKTDAGADAYLRQLGASEILDRRKIDLNGPPLEKGRWGGAIDNAGGDLLSWLTRTTCPWGNVVSIGLAAGSQLNTTVMPFILRAVSLLGVTASGCPTALRQQLWQNLATDWHPQHLQQIVTRRVGLEDLPDIFTGMLKGELSGRTLVEINPEN